MAETNSLAELQELLAKASPLPWTLEQCGNDWRAYDATGELVCEVEEDGSKVDNMRLAVAAINALPALLSALSTTQQERDEAHKKHFALALAAGSANATLACLLQGGVDLVANRDGLERAMIELRNALDVDYDAGNKLMDILTAAEDRADNADLLAHQRKNKINTLKAIRAKQAKQIINLSASLTAVQQERDEMMVQRDDLSAEMERCHRMLDVHWGYSLETSAVDTLEDRIKMLLAECVAFPTDEKQS